MWFLEKRMKQTKKLKTKQRFEKEYETWCRLADLSEAEKKQLKGMSGDERYESFYRQVPFGTAGMRGKVGLGSNRLNRYTIRLAAWGMARLLGAGKKVAIAYDTRLDSRDFAEEAARVLACAGVHVLLFDRPSPVPLLSYTVRTLHCDGGIVITASHNTKVYNGFKTYEASGAQMGPEKTGAISEWMKQNADPLDIPRCDDLSQENIEWIGDGICEDFIRATVRCSRLSDRAAKRAVNVVYTPLFGSGRDFVLQALDKDGFEQVHLVAEQAEFNGNFPGLNKPNPEEPEVLRIAERQALECQADLIIATDPDSDRIGAGVIRGTRLIPLSGNQIGALLADFISRQDGAAHKKMVTTIVTGDLGEKLVRARGGAVIRTLTGSKFVCEEINRMKPEEFLFGYEESHGYISGDHIRDKDGVSAALLLCEAAAWHKAHGRTLLDALDTLYREYGYYIDAQDSFVFEGEKGIRIMQKIMTHLRSHGEGVFQIPGGMEQILDYSKGLDGLPCSNVLKFRFEGGSWIAARPSGTEPKIKFYYCMRGSTWEEAESLYRKAQGALEEFLRTF